MWRPAKVGSSDPSSAPVFVLACHLGKSLSSDKRQASSVKMSPISSSALKHSVHARYHIFALKWRRLTDVQLVLASTLIPDLIWFWFWSC